MGTRYRDGMTATIDHDPDTLHDDDGPPDLGGLAAVVGAQCPRQPWCVRGAGHPGFCGKRPRGEGRAPRNRAKTAKTSSGRPASSPARRGKAKASGLMPILSLAWSGIGQAVEAYSPEPAGPPVGRVLQFQAPYAATVLDKVLTDHVPAYKAIDAMTGGILDELGPLILPPLLVAVMASRPQTAAGLYPLLAGQLEQLAIAMTAERRRVRDALSATAELDEESAQLVNELAQVLFAPRPEAPPAEGDDDGPAGAWPA